MTKVVNIGAIACGGENPVSIQSMTNTDTTDAQATLAQCLRLQNAGCEIVRVSVYNAACVPTISVLKEHLDIPVVADIHFDADLAVASVEAGVDKLRINPGNIGGEDKVRYLADCLKAHRIPVRIGVNAGSLQKDLLAQYGATAQAMVQSALVHAKMLEDCGFYDIVISLKASDVLRTVESFRIISKIVDYPLHVGVTEAGLPEDGIIKNAIGIGSLLLDGIGSTLRVSLTGDPIEEVKAGQTILRSLGLRRDHVDIIACPTCGRCQYNLEEVAQKVRAATRHIKKPLKVAIMGCVVNGPGEATEADIGIAGGKESGVLFKQGKRVRTVSAADMVQTLLDEINLMI